MEIHKKRSLVRLAQLGSLLLSVSSPLDANIAETQSLEAVAQAVNDFIVAEQSSDNEVRVDVKSLDDRLRLARCEEPLLAQWSPGSRSIGRVTVQVACAGAKPWRVHVQASVTLEGYVWVLTRSVQRGEVLDPDSLARQAVKLGANNAAFMSLGQPILDLEPWSGYAFSQRVAVGKVLNERMLKPALLVKKGEAVLIRIESTGLKLQTKGVALKGAAAGKAVQVRNSSTGKVIDAVVVAKGVVAVLN